VWSYHDKDGEIIPLVSGFYRTHVVVRQCEVRVTIKKNSIKSTSLQKKLHDQPKDSTNYSKDDDGYVCIQKGHSRREAEPTHDESYLSDLTPLISIPNSTGHLS
jgi:hypothetical protein